MLEELRARRDQLAARLQEIHTEASNPETAAERQAELQTEWDSVNEEFDRAHAEVQRVEARQARITEISGIPASTERVDVGVGGTPREDPFDLSTVRASIFDAPEAVAGELRTRALRAIEATRMPEEMQARAASVLDRFEGPGLAELSRRILVTGSPAYKRGFAKYLAGRPMSEDEARAMSVGTGSAGGFAVPYDLDPTIIGTWTPGVNPTRDLCQAAGTVITTVSNEWRGVTSGGVVASYAAEAAEAGDNSPTLTQPSIFPERAQCFVPFSFELDQDWGQLRAELSREMLVAREDLEATKFALGAGHGSLEPQGLVSGLGAGQNVPTTGVAAFAVADIYKLLEAVPVRHRSGARARFLANLAIYDKVRQFDTQGGASLWVQLAQDVPPTLVGRPSYESSPMSGAVATGNIITVLGNFEGYKIVDRIGMEVELIPHLFGTNRRPTGQRGLYAFWRNSAGLVNADAFRKLTVA